MKEEQFEQENVPQEEAQTQDIPENTTEETAVAEEETIDPIAQLEAQLAEQQDKYLRLAAEFDNFRRRTMKEKAELIKNGGEKTISAVLPILDDIERAVETAGKTEDVAAVVEGLNLIQQKFLKTLQGEGLEKIEATGTAFDTDIHEAIAMVPAPTAEQKDTVLDCVQAGYKLNDKVIRHAKVVVAQ